MPPDRPGALFGAFECEGNHHERFHRHWGHLHDPHVRALAWLLDAPDLLDVESPRWQGKIASFQIDPPAVHAWLSALDKNPSVLTAYLAKMPTFRLGRYAEKLLTFYFEWNGTLMAHGLQVQACGGNTIGEFDFLLYEGQNLVHIELATKFYLFETAPSTDVAEYFIGPNLADTLGAKMQKILHRQLALASHPAAHAYLPQPVTRSQALVKGWLFYQHSPSPPLVSAGVASDHCRGFWCSLSEFLHGDFMHASTIGFLHLPRLAWLAPASAASHEVQDHHDVSAFLATHFSVDSTPVMIALMRISKVQENLPTLQTMYEFARCFVVPDDWRGRVSERNQRTILQSEVA